MADSDLFRRSLDAGVAFTQLTRQRAEKMVRELVQNGDVSREQATARVEELLERSRQNSEAILAIVRKEIDDRIAALNLVTREDLANLAAKLGLPGLGGRVPSRPAPRSTAAQKTTRKPATTPVAKKTAPAKKTTAAKKTAGSARKATTGTAKKATTSAKKA